LAKGKRVLVVDDEPKILRFIKANLQASDFEVITAETGAQGLEEFARHNPDLVLLDVMLPDISGFEVCGQIREMSDVPIMMVTAKGDPHDAVAGLDAGADDYIAKPFDVQELLARVRAVLRRGAVNRDTFAVNPVITCGTLRIDSIQHRVEVGGQEVRLTPTEFRLLGILAAHPGKVLTHEFLLTSVWGNEYRDDTHYLRVCIGRVRQKLKQAGEDHEYIVTVPTVGYRMTPPRAQSGR